MEKQPGMVSFVGAGPGDPELLTLKGKRLIEEAALLLYAGSMIPPALLDLASPRASVIDAAPLDLEECHSLMLQFARAGQPVVHLHTGDPAVYSALREQLALLDRDGIPWQVVPGITAASAAAAAAGCSFTVPGATQSLIMTRMPGRTPMPEQEALRHLAKHGTTLAVYLSAMQARAMQEELEQSLPAATPSAWAGPISSSSAPASTCWPRPSKRTASPARPWSSSCPAREKTPRRRVPAARIPITIDTIRESALAFPGSFLSQSSFPSVTSQARQRAMAASLPSLRGIC